MSSDVRGDMYTAVHCLLMPSHTESSGHMEYMCLCCKFLQLYGEKMRNSKQVIRV